MHSKNITLTEEALARRIAAELLVDVRTVRRALAGAVVRGVVGQRISDAIAAARSQGDVSSSARSSASSP